MSVYDWNDPDIRKMVDFNHEPEERITITGGGFASISKPTCRACHQEWPCPTINQLRAWQRDDMMKFWKKDDSLSVPHPSTPASGTAGPST